MLILFINLFINVKEVKKFELNLINLDLISNEM